MDTDEHNGKSTERPKAFRSLAKRPERSLGFQLWLASNAWQRAIDVALVPLGVTHTQYALLTALDRLESIDGPVTQSMLSHHSGVDEMMTSQVARALERRGLLTRVPSPTDSRAKILNLTPEGSDVCKAGVEVVEETDRRLFGVMNGQLFGFTEGLSLFLTSVSPRSQSGDPTENDGHIR